MKKYPLRQGGEVVPLQASFGFGENATSGADKKVRLRVMPCDLARPPERRRQPIRGSKMTFECMDWLSQRGMRHVMSWERFPFAINEDTKNIFAQNRNIGG